MNTTDIVNVVKNAIQYLHNPVYVDLGLDSYVGKAYISYADILEFDKEGLMDKDAMGFDAEQFTALKRALASEGVKAKSDDPEEFIDFTFEYKCDDDSREPLFNIEN